MDFIVRYFHELWVLSAEMAPWLLLGLVFAGLLKVWFPQDKIGRYLGGKNVKSSVNAALLGIPLPLCSCGVIPTGIAFFRNGASRGATNSFLISTPQTGIDSIFATYSLLGLPFAIIRPVVAFLTGIFGGILTNFFDKTPPVMAGQTDKNATNCSGDCACETECKCDDEACSCEEKPSRSKFYTFWHYAFVELLQDISKWLIIGFLAAALISVLVPENFFTRFNGQGIVEILIVLAISIPLYVCATGSIPIAAVLLAKGISPGAALVFLMAGPATNIATITVIGKTMGRRSLILYLISIIGGAIFFGELMNAFVPVDWIMKSIPLGHAGHHHEEMLPTWVRFGSLSILLLAIMGGYFYTRYVKHNKMIKTQGISLKVTGMSCSHCEANVQRSLMSIDGIEQVVADNKAETVKISGKSIDLDKVGNTINALGYKYIGIRD